MVKGKARAAGSFLGGLANNPAVVIIAIVLGGLFLFRDKISDAFGSLGEGLGDINISLPDINLPEFKFPEFNFPEFKFPDITFPEFTLPDFSGLFDQGGITPPAQDPAGDPDLSIGLAGGIQQRRMDLERGLLERDLEAADIPLRDIGDQTTGLSPAQRFAFIERGVIPTGFQVVNGQLVQEADFQGIAEPITQPSISSFLLDDPTQQFEGGGISFQGGSIFETPIQNLSLSQIIDKFMVTASQAANIKAIAADDFGDFDFGTNTGQGIGSVTPFIPSIQQTNVSDNQFQGLTAQEIFLRLTGGNISNF